MSKTNGNNRLSALKRLGNSFTVNNSNRRQLTGAKSQPVNDARQLLVNRNKPAFDARQLLSRQSSNTSSKNIIVRKNLLNEPTNDNNNGKMVVVTGLKDMTIRDGKVVSSPVTSNAQLAKPKKIFAVGPSTYVTIRNNNSNSINTSLNQPTEKISFTKTIKNTTVRREDDDRPKTTNTLPDQKVVISFVNDQYQKNPKPSRPATTITSSSSPIHPQPVIKRLHDASIQTTSSPSSSRSPIRMSSHRRHTNITMDDQDHMATQTIDDDEDVYEPPVKRTTSTSTTRKTTAAITTKDREQQSLSAAASTGSVKRTSTGAPVSSRVTSNASTVSKPISTTPSTSTPGTILVTNLQPSVTEEDVIELFGEIGRINEITTLSQGCVQIIYAKREHGEQAVAKYHNRLLDGQFMYVSLQQPTSYSTTQNSKTSNNTQPSSKENGTSANTSSTTNQPLKLNSTSSNSNKITIDPTFFRQALFHPSNNTANPVQFQVKL